MLDGTLLEQEFAKYRDDFPLLKKTHKDHSIIYFDSAATAQKPQCVIDAISNFYEKDYGTVNRAVYQLAKNSTEKYHLARKTLQYFLNAKKQEEIIFTRGTTESINLIATSFGKAFVKPGDEILITETEHHANIVPWKILCEEREAVLKIIPVDDRGVLLLDEYKNLINDKTALVAVAHVSNATGTVHPIKEIIQIAHSKGVKAFIDGAQAAQHIAVDVQDLDADFYVFSGHKTYGPTGIGVLYGKEALLNQMPPYQGGGDMIDTVTFEKVTYQNLPLKFEAGTPMIAEVIGLGTAIEYLNKIGLNKISKWEQELLCYATEKIKQIDGIKIIGTAPEKGALISLVFDKIHPLDLASLLDCQGISVRTGHLCAQPTMKRFGVSSVLRLSFAFYNTKKEIDAFIEILKKNIKFLVS